MIETTLATERSTAGSPVLLAPLGLEALAARLGAPGVRVERLGMGPARAAGAAQRLSAVLPAAIPVAVLGLGGGCSRDDRPGDVVVASELLAEAGSAPAVRIDSALCGRLTGALSERFPGRVRSGPVLSTERLVRAARLEVLGAETGALACETESAFLGELAEGRPFAVVRVLVDRPGRPLPGPWTVPAGTRALVRLASVARCVAGVLAELEDSP